MQKLLDWLAVLIRPRYWLLLYPYSRFWDEKLRELMNEHDFVVLDKWTAQLGPVKVWIENMPYAAFTLYTLDTPGLLTVKQELRASRATIYRATQKLRRDSGISGDHIGPERTIRKIFDDIEGKPSLKVVK